MGEILRDVQDSAESDSESVVSKVSAKATPSIESIGPPKILQYKPETKKIEISPPSPTLSLDSEPIDDLGMFLKDFNVYINGGHTCEFCGMKTKEWPSIENQDMKKLEELYCCNDYQEFVEGLLEYQNEREKLKKGDVILQPKNKKASKKAKKLAKERAEFRAMQRLVEKQKKLEQLAAKQQQQAEEAKNQTTKNAANKPEKANVLIDSSSKHFLL